MRRNILLGVLFAGFALCLALYLMPQRQAMVGPRMDKGSNNGSESGRDISTRRFIPSDAVVQHGNAADSAQIIERANDASLGSIVADAQMTHTLSERLKAAQSLGHQLSRGETEILCNFLRTISDEDEHRLRNDVMDILVWQDEPVPTLVNLLQSIYENPEQDMTMRDYALQHMAPAYKRVSALDQERLRQTLWAALKEKYSGTAGTALIVLQDLSRFDHSIDGKALSESARKLAVDEHCNELTRITAVSVCGRMSSPESILPLLELARRNTSFLVRVAAVGALGNLPSPEANSVLQSLNSDSDPRIRIAAQSSLQRLNRKAN